MKKDQFAANAFSALGNQARLSLLRLLVRIGEEGLNIGDLQRELGIPASTLAHHLGILARSQLISQERLGRQIINRANFPAIRTLAAYLTEECCTGLEVKILSGAA